MLGWGVPLAVLVTVGILAGAAVLGLQVLNRAAGYATSDADAMLQNQVGIMNPELASPGGLQRPAASVQHRCHQLVFGAEFLGTGVGALAHLGTACGPRADVILTKPVETPSSVATAITTATTTVATASWASTAASPSTTTEESTSVASSTTTNAAAS